MLTAVSKNERRPPDSVRSTVFVGKLCFCLTHTISSENVARVSRAKQAVSVEVIDLYSKPCNRWYSVIARWKKNCLARGARSPSRPNGNHVRIARPNGDVYPTIPSARKTIHCRIRISVGGGFEIKKKKIVPPRSKLGRLASDRSPAYAIRAYLWKCNREFELRVLS